MVWRFGAAALVFLFASMTFAPRAQACDSRIAGSCPNAPITHPGTLVEGGGESAEPARATRTSASRKRWRYRKRSARRSRVATPKPLPPVRAQTESPKREAQKLSEENLKKPALSAAPVDQPLTRIAPPDGSASENTGSFVATSAAAIAAATTKTRSITPTAAPPPPVSRNVISEAQVNASLLAPPSAPVRTTFVSGNGAKLPVAEAQPAAEPEPETAVERVAYVAPVAQPTVSSASAPPVSDMTTLRAVVLAMVGLLAVGTAVRMVV